MSQSETKEKKSASKLPDPEVAMSEVAYVTAIDPATKTFFAQFCKYTNQELIFANKTLDDFSKEAVADTNKAAAQQVTPLRTRDLVCARYSKDGNWYRGLILRKLENKTKFEIFYVDYGNVEIVEREHILKTNELPILSRVPFGVSCYWSQGNSFTGEQWKKFFTSIKNKYILVEMKKPMSNIQWEVDIPLHGYNMLFWRDFLPHRFRCRMLIDVGKGNSKKRILEENQEKKDLAELLGGSLSISSESDS